jgi:hypothetical protein
LGAWQANGYQFWGVLALTLGALLAYPLFQTTYPLFQSVLQTSPAVPPAPKESLASERERVLKLLEAGRITPAESADLLNALGETVQPAPTATASVSPARRMILAGGVLVLVAFFLPWFALNPGEEVNRIAERMGQAIPQALGLNANMHLPFNVNTGTLRVAGGDIGHGLGWFVLLFGLAAAALPFANLGMDRRALNGIALAPLGVGAVMLLYLLSQNFRFVSVGIMLALAGYGLILLGTLKEGQTR